MENINEFVAIGCIIGLVVMFVAGIKDKWEMVKIVAFGTFIILALGIISSCIIVTPWQ